MSLSQQLGRFNQTQSSLMHVEGAPSFSQLEDTLLTGLGADAAVFGSQSMLTQELKAGHYSLSQESVYSSKSAAYRRNEPALEHDSDKTGSMLSHNAATMTETHQESTSRFEAPLYQDASLPWDSLLNAVDHELKEQTIDLDLDVEEDTALLDRRYTSHHESLILAYAGSPTKSPMKDCMIKSIPKLKAENTVKHVLQAVSPNRAAITKQRLQTAKHPPRRTSSRRIDTAKERISAVSALLSNVPNASEELSAASGRRRRSSHRAAGENVILPEMQEPSVRSAARSSGKQVPTAAEMPPAASRPKASSKRKASASSKRKASASSNTADAAQSKKRSRPAGKKPRLPSPAKLQKANRKVSTVADLMAQVLTACPAASKELFVHMVLIHSQPAARRNPVKGYLELSFQWNHYPAMENVLLANMARYYELSSSKNHFREQYSFNNGLAEQVMEVAKKHGWRFDHDVTTRQIRDRIRCYFKTLIQNAKKRLATLLRDRTDGAMEQIEALWRFCRELPEVVAYSKKKRFLEP